MSASALAMTRRTTPLLTAYGLAGRALVPFVPLLLARRARKGKEEVARRDERYGHAGRARPDGPLVWIHAASVGETNAVLPLVRRIAASGTAVVLTTITVTSAEIAARHLPPGALHQYAPLDIAPYVDRFLDTWRPDAALFVESELWPVMTLRLAARGIAQIRVNARMSERSFARWRKFSGVRPLFEGTTLALAQSEGDALRLRALGLRQVRSVGNLKFDVPPPGADPEALVAVSAMTAGREIFVAASTHDGEEAIVAAAHRSLRSRRPGLLTVIVPRHPVRGTALRDALAASGLVVAQRSRGEGVTPETDIYLADTLGELGLFYRLAPVALVGGTLVPVGGHNPIEAARLDTAIVHGPHVKNAAEIYAALDSGTESGPVADANELADMLESLFADPQAMRDRARRAAESLDPFAGALDATMAALAPFLGQFEKTRQTEGGA